MTPQEKLVSAVAEYDMVPIEFNFFDVDTDIVITHEALADFTNQFGPAHETPENGLLVWKHIQRVKGQPRGDLYILDCGDCLAIYSEIF
ncbi:MAG: hypothetical protein V3R83_12400 [Gammaproteobacteria bacterium]